MMGMNRTGGGGGGVGGMFRQAQDRQGQGGGFFRGNSPFNRSPQPTVTAPVTERGRLVRGGGPNGTTFPESPIDAGGRVPPPGGRPQGMPGQFGRQPGQFGRPGGNPQMQRQMMQAKQMRRPPNPSGSRMGGMRGGVGRY